MLAQATMNGDAAGQAALEELCRRYWPAVRDTLLARRFPPEEAEDICQDFFSNLLTAGMWHQADRAKGRFRSYLMGALDRTLTQRHRHASRLKRGGGLPDVPLEEAPEPIVAEDELRFDRAWAERVLEMALDALEQEMTQNDRGTEFSALVGFLGSSAGEASSQLAASQLEISPGALKTKVFRLRQRFRESILAEIARTVETLHEAEQEMAHLFEVINRPDFSLAALTESETGPSI